jgi:hypothetical protein
MDSSCLHNAQFTVRSDIMLLVSIHTSRKAGSLGNNIHMVHDIDDANHTMRIYQGTFTS